MPCPRSIRGARTSLSPRERAGVRVARAPSGSPQLRRRVTRQLSAWVGLALGLFPTWVLACPTCTARAPEATGRSALLVGGMLLLPFLLVALGVWAAWRAARGDAKRGP
jgi:hypothetical protein